MACQRAEILARNYPREFRGQKVWQSVPMHSLIYPANQSGDSLHGMVIHGMPHRHRRQALSVPNRSGFQPTEYQEFFLSPRAPLTLTSYHSAGAELLTMASGDILRRVQSSAGLTPHACVPADCSQCLMHASVPLSIPSPSWRASSCGGSHPHAVRLPASASTGTLNAVGGASPSPPTGFLAAPARLPQSRSSGHLHAVAACRLPFHASGSSGKLQQSHPQGGMAPVDPATMYHASVCPGSAVAQLITQPIRLPGMPGTVTAMSKLSSLSVSAQQPQHVSTSAPAGPPLRRGTATDRSACMLATPGSGTSLGLPCCSLESAMSSSSPSAAGQAACSPLAPAPVDTHASQLLGGRPVTFNALQPLPDTSDGPCAAASTVAQTHLPPAGGNYRGGYRGNYSGLSARHRCCSASDLPASHSGDALHLMHARSDHIQNVFEASECSNLNLSAEVRVLVRANGSVKLAFPARPHVYFSRFATTLLWAAVLGLGILARSPELKSEDSWMLRLVGYESRTLRACVCTFIGFWVLLGARFLFPEQDTIVVDIEGVPADMHHYMSTQSCLSQGGGIAREEVAQHAHRWGAAEGGVAGSQIYGRWSVSKMPRWWPEALPEDDQQGSLQRPTAAWRRWLRCYAVTYIVRDAPLATLAGCQVWTAAYPLILEPCDVCLQQEFCFLFLELHLQRAPIEIELFLCIT